MVWNYACFLAVLLLPGLWVASESTREVGLLSMTSCPSLPRSILPCFMSGGRTYSFLPFSWDFHRQSAWAQTCFFYMAKRKLLIILNIALAAEVPQCLSWSYSDFSKFLDMTLWLMNSVSSGPSNGQHYNGTSKAQHSLPLCVHCLQRTSHLSLSCVS